MTLPKLPSSTASPVLGGRQRGRHRAAALGRVRHRSGAQSERLASLPGCRLERLPPPRPLPRLTLTATASRSGPSFGSRTACPRQRKKRPQMSAAQSQARPPPRRLHRREQTRQAGRDGANTPGAACCRARQGPMFAALLRTARHRLSRVAGKPRHARPPGCAPVPWWLMACRARVGSDTTTLTGREVLNSPAVSRRSTPPETL